MNQPQDVDDMMQDLFIKALGQGAKFCDIANARAWLFEVARNAMADRLKVRREMVELPDDLASEDADHEAVDLLSACLPRVLSELSPSDREAIDLCDLEGLPRGRTRGSSHWHHLALLTSRCSVLARDQLSSV